MPRNVFDDAQLSAMKRAIDQLTEEFGPASGIRRDNIAHAVFMLASEEGEFDSAKLAESARRRLTRAQTKQTA